MDKPYGASMPDPVDLLGADSTKSHGDQITRRDIIDAPVIEDVHWAG